MERKKRMRECMNLWLIRGKNKLLGLWKKEYAGMSSVEVVVLTMVLLTLAILFKNQITGVVNSLFMKITEQTNRL